MNIFILAGKHEASRDISSSGGQTRQGATSQQQQQQQGDRNIDALPTDDQKLVGRLVKARIAGNTKS